MDKGHNGQRRMWSKETMDRGDYDHRTQIGRKRRRPKPKEAVGQRRDHRAGRVYGQKKRCNMASFLQGRQGKGESVGFLTERHRDEDDGKGPRTMGNGSGPTMDKCRGQRQKETVERNGQQHRKTMDKGNDGQWAPWWSKETMDKGNCRQRKIR